MQPHRRQKPPNGQTLAASSVAGERRCGGNSSKQLWQAAALWQRQRTTRREQRLGTGKRRQAVAQRRSNEQTRQRATMGKQQEVRGEELAVVARTQQVQWGNDFYPLRGCPPTAIAVRFRLEIWSVQSPYFLTWCCISSHTYTVHVRYV